MLDDYPLKSASFFLMIRYNKILHHLEPNNTLYIEHNLICDFSRIEELISYIRKNYNGQKYCVIDQHCEGLLLPTMQFLPVIFTLLSDDTEFYLNLGLMPSERSVESVKQVFSNFFIHKSLNVLFSGYWMTAVLNNRDYEPSFNIDINKPQKFLCYNNAGRPWRTDIAFALQKMGAINDSILSCILAVEPKHSILYSNDNEFAEFTKTVPVYYNMETGKYDAGYNNIVRQHYENTYISIVTESRFTRQQTQSSSVSGVFLTEKTFRTIIAGHPFILISEPYSLQALKETGFKTFSDVIDESYDEIKDDKQRLRAIIAEIERLNNFTEDQWLDFQLKTKPIRKHNFDNMKNLFYQESDITVTRLEKK